MCNEEEIIKYLHKILNKQRFEHSLRVMDTAVSLAKHYKIDETKARLAGLVHDCAKNLKDDEILHIIKKNSQSIEECYKMNPSIMHGLAGAIMARDNFKVTDEDILNAVAYHTTGRENMSMLEKIIYIADYIEPMRNFPGVQELRENAYNDLDRALLLSFNNTINYVISKGEILHLDTIKARNYILMKECR
ncbi:bis(5'-nucleosyl)-tetraphosphatase (symmetrical) YqeK [Clostridium sp. SYSU_GA19001]|uniref:bis(5'-nucleosyl)-tetraphosphatase (symmetrical) YqeK n=1 Tax=Clostridium caldaquaticum TaxID=2940653 RepID=UPI002077008A|nr:bis(5'-nucleosyl)-tetraphosphatase (symmetrical) YqeK [Clostridium caldaquaticum]MCM8710385.1 bis(5'-nucleosyl)-tetraphosphatase (symmetrical) YqeK [Clostridium caldaquaticum]